jgi:hypothetical protein
MYINSVFFKDQWSPCFRFYYFSARIFIFIKNNFGLLHRKIHDILQTRCKFLQGFYTFSDICIWACLIPIHLVQKMWQPEKVYIDSVFIIHGTMLKIRRHVVYSMFKKHADNCYTWSLFYKHGRITIAGCNKILTFLKTLYKSRSLIIRQI